MIRWVTTIASLFVLWFGGWFALAWWADGRVGDILTAADQQGVAIGCADREIIGFPFRLGLRCESLQLEQRHTSTTLSTGSIRSLALLYRPDELLTEADSPVIIRVFGQTITLNWKSMQIYSDVEFEGGFDRLSLNARDVQADTNAIAIAANSIGLHARPRPSSDDGAARPSADLDIAASANDAEIAAVGQPAISNVNVALDATLIEGYADLVKSRLPLPDILADGGHLIIRRLSLAPASGGRLALEGALDLDAAGLLSGTLSIGLADAERLTAWAASLSPALQQSVAMLAQAVTGMGQPASIGGEKGLRTIQLQLSHGELRLGFIKIADIPPLAL